MRKVIKTLALALGFAASITTQAGWFGVDEKEYDYGQGTGYYLCWADAGLGFLGFEDSRPNGFSEDFWSGFSEGCYNGTENYHTERYRKADGKSASEFSKDMYGYILENQSENRVSILWGTWYSQYK